MRLTLERRLGQRRVRHVKVATIVRDLAAGARTIALPVRVGGRRLAKGAYRVSVQGVAPDGRLNQPLRKAFVRR